jgi:uncharacterized damage-inducible protein DinB
MPTPYAQYVEDRDPVDVLRSSLQRYRSAIARFTDETWRRSLGPGKWTMREVMVHVAQWEAIFGARLLFGVSVPGYVVQPGDQDLIMQHIGAIDGPTAFAAFDAARRMNLALIDGLSPELRRRTFAHPERGTIDATDVMVTMAGHAAHHLLQVESVVNDRT